MTTFPVAAHEADIVFSPSRLTRVPVVLARLLHASVERKVLHLLADRLVAYWNRNSSPTVQVPM